MGNYREGHLDIILKEDTPMEIILLMMDLADYDDDIFSSEKKTREERIARLKYKNQDKLFKSEYLDWVHLDIIFEILSIDNKFDWYTYEGYKAYILLNESGLENNLKNLEKFYCDALDSDKKYHKVIEHILQHKFRKIKFHFSICSKYYDNELDKIFEFLKPYIEETEECIGELHDEDGYLGKEYYLKENIFNEIISKQKYMCEGCPNKPSRQDDVKCENYDFCSIAYDNGRKNKN